MSGILFSPGELELSLARLSMNPANLVVPVVLFVLLIPGLLVLAEVVSVSPFVSVNPGLLVSQGVSDVQDLLDLVIPSVSMNSVLTHAVVYAAVYFFLRTKFAEYYY